MAKVKTARLTRINKTEISPAEAERYVIRNELRNSEEWKRLKLEFSTDELKLLEERYMSFLQQMRGDLLASETTQLMQAIKLEILMSRILISRQEVLTEERTIKEQIREIMTRAGNKLKNLPDDDRKDIIILREQLVNLKSTADDREAHFVKLHSEHKSLMKDLKATRDQRVREISDSTSTILGLIKKLQRKDFQDKEARENELVKIATEKEYRRLGQLHKYEDGAYDRPVLSSDTIDLPNDNAEELQ